MRGPYYRDGDGSKTEPGQVIEQIKLLCRMVTAGSYDDAISEGYGYLTMLRDMGQTQEQVYRPLAGFYEHLEEGLSRDCAAGLLDFVVGWCAPQWHVWGDRDEKKGGLPQDG